MLVLLLGILVLAVHGMIGTHGEEDRVGYILAAALVMTLDLVSMCGFFVVAPNRSIVLTLFGKYKGRVRNGGLHWANPFLGKMQMSLRVRNFETTHLKVNDHDGNPIKIAAVVV